MDPQTGALTEVKSDSPLELNGATFSANSAVKGQLFVFDDNNTDDLYRYDVDNSFARTDCILNIIPSYNAGLGDLAADICSDTDIPGTPSLESPSNGATNVSTTPILSWGAVTDATTYDVQVCSDSGCSSVVASATGLTSPEWTVSPALNKLTAYWWRVQANNSCGSGPWSDIWRLTTGNCFIATAAFGTTMEGKIDVLRSFRDAYLSKTPIGEAFVAAYYTHSPPAADYIAQRGWLRAVVRILLTPVIGFISLFV